MKSKDFWDVRPSYWVKFTEVSEERAVSNYMVDEYGNSVFL
jgi:hypothetical protein